MLPGNEESRLRRLCKLDVLVAFTEPIFKLSTSFISALGGTQVDFVATHGLSNLRKLPRKQAFCSLPVKYGSTIVLNAWRRGRANKACAQGVGGRGLGLRRQSEGGQGQGSQRREASWYRSRVGKRKHIQVYTMAGASAGRRLRVHKIAQPAQVGLGVLIQTQQNSAIRSSSK